MHVAAERRARVEPGGQCTDALELEEALGQPRARILRLPGGQRVVGEQQAGFQPGEPGRHHQPVGGELEADAAGPLDHREILLHQRQDGDAREIDLFAAREVEQQVERPLEPVQRQQQRFRPPLLDGGQDVHGGTAMEAARARRARARSVSGGNLASRAAVSAKRPAP